MRMTTVNKRIVLLLGALFLLALPLQAFSLPMTQETIYTDYLFQGHTWMYTSFVDLYTEKPDGWEGGYWIGSGDDMDNFACWQHTLPEGLSVPPDRIDRAKLWIDAEYVQADGSTIGIQGVWNWDPLNSRFDAYDNAMYVLTDVTTPGFWNNGFLGVEVFSGEGMLRIDQAALLMDYTQMVIPEPASMLLFGLGLIGSALYRRRK